MKLSDLVNFQSNEGRLIDIRKNRKNIVPFIGAGVSKGCGLYTWQELLDKLAVEYFTKEEIEDLKLNKNVFDYAEEIVKASGNSEMIMRRIRELISTADVHLTEIPYLLVSMFSPMVITTNYDSILEEVSINSKLGRIKPLLPCLVEQMHKAIVLDERRLLKLHGSVEEISSFVFSLSHYKKYYGEKGDREKRLLPAYLSRIFEDKKVLFVGCSLDEDYTLEILKECMEKNHYISHYAIVPYLKDEKQQIIRQRKFTSMGIEPIFYPEGDFQAVGRLVTYLSDENSFLSFIKDFLTELFKADKEAKKKIYILLALVKESFYNTSLKFPQLLDVENLNDDFEKDVIENVGYKRMQSDTLYEIFIRIFSAYIRVGKIRCGQEIIDCFRENFANSALQEDEIAYILERKWSLSNLLCNEQPNMAWLANISDAELNRYAQDFINKLQYRNGMDFSDVIPVYNNAKEFIEKTKGHLEFEIKIKLLNSLGAFGHYCKDFVDAERYLEECIKEIDDSGNVDKSLMLFKAKCYANLAIVRGTQNVDIEQILDAAEKDISLKRKYKESDFFYSRSLNYYATVVKEINPFKAVDIYIETCQVKKRMISNGQSGEQIREMTASWATTVFNVGLLAKDLELYEIAYKIVSYANHYRFKTFDYCNRDYCSSINVFAELELFVHEKKNLGWIIDGIQSRKNLPNGFTNTLVHTWYVCAYYFYLQKEYETACKYINKAIYESKKEGVIYDFRQDIRISILLGDIKVMQGKLDEKYLGEAEKIYKDVIKDIIDMYGKESYYLIAPYRCLQKLGEVSSEKCKYREQYQYLLDRHRNNIREAEEKFEDFFKYINRDKYTESLKI